MVKILKDLLFVLFHPSYWLMNYHYCETWDRHIKNLMAKHKFVACGGYTAKLGDTEIWIENHPYASMTPYLILKVRPSRRTIRSAYLKYTEDVIKEMISP